MMEKPQQVQEYEKNEQTLKKIRKKAYRAGKSGETLVTCLRKAGLFERYDEITDRQMELEETLEYRTYRNQGVSAKLKMSGISIF